MGLAAAAIGGIAAAGTLGAPAIAAAVPEAAAVLELGALGVPGATGAVPATSAALAAAVLTGVTATALVPLLATAVQVFPPARTQTNPEIAAMSVIFTRRK